MGGSTLSVTYYKRCVMYMVSSCNVLCDVYLSMSSIPFVGPCISFYLFRTVYWNTSLNDIIFNSMLLNFFRTYVP
jgi:hypothetical protein